MNTVEGDQLLLHVSEEVWYVYCGNVNRSITHGKHCTDETIFADERRVFLIICFDLFSTRWAQMREYNLHGVFTLEL